MYLVGSWVVFCMFQYVIFLYNYIISCEVDNNDLTPEQSADYYMISYKIVYWVIIIRDLTCLAILIIFQQKAANSQLYFNRLLDLNDKDSTRVALQDFEMLLVSVVPHKAFSKFIRTEHSEMIPYLQMVHLCKLYQDDQEMLE